MLKQNEDGLQNTLAYLLKNSENMDESQQAFLKTFIPSEQEPFDPIHQLQRLSLNELTYAYDTLLSMLKGREQSIKDKLKEILDHRGIEERILSDSKDWKREIEDVPDVLLRIYKMNIGEIDQILGINEQIQNVEIMKTLPPEEKMYQFMTDTANFTAERNWNDEQLSFANNPEFFHNKTHSMHHPHLTRKEIMDYGPAPSRWDPQYYKLIQDKVKTSRAEFETPFDEVYHKERKLVQDIIRAEKAIKAIQAKLPNPIENRMFDPADISEHPVYG